MDLTIEFKAREVVATFGLDAFYDVEVVALILTGKLEAEFGGMPIESQDFVWIISKWTENANQTSCASAEKRPV